MKKLKNSNILPDPENAKIHVYSKGPLTEKDHEEIRATIAKSKAENALRSSSKK